MFICVNTKWGRPSSGYVGTADACLSSQLSIYLNLHLQTTLYKSVETVLTCTWPCSIYVCTHATSLLLIVDYLILWSCPLFLEWLAHLQDCKCGNTPCDLTPAILARLLQTFSHADLIKYSLEVAQRKMILDPIFLPLKSPDILITPKGKLKDKKVIYTSQCERTLLAYLRYKCR